MKISNHSRVVVLVALMAAPALLVASGGRGLLTWKSASGPSTGSTLGGVDKLAKTLQAAGFGLTPGEFTYWDLVEATCQGDVPQAGNNPWPNVYLSLKLPPHPDVTPPLPIDRYWQLGEDEAIVLVGQTPPSVRFFHYQTFAIIVPGFQYPLRLPVGDAVNIGTIRTIGPDKYQQPIVYIITGNRETERRVREAALKAGYPDAIINVEAISPVIAPLGVGDEGSWFVLVHRLAAPLDKTAVEAFAKKPGYQVFRVKPNPPLADDPEPVPVLRVRGNGHTEMPLYPTLKKLRKAILDRYAGMPRQELDTKVTQVVQLPDKHDSIAEKPFVGLQRGVDVFGASRDNTSLTSYPTFKLRDGKTEFAIVYGVNHQTTGKAIYASFTPYVDMDRWFGLKDGTMTSNDYDGTGMAGDSARWFLCPGDAAKCPADVQYLYAWKIARRCGVEDGPYCMPLKAEFINMHGQAYECNLYDWYKKPTDPPLIGPFDLNTADINITWRSYMEPATNAGPDENELLIDRAIYFGSEEK